MGRTVRSVGLGECDAIMAVMQPAFDPRYGEAWTRDQLAGIMIMPGCLLLLAEEDGRPAGFALFRHVLDEAELLLLAVHPDWRRQGIGKTLLEVGAEVLRAKSVRSMFLEMREGNPAFHLYSHLGFEVVGRRRDYYRCGENARCDALSLRKNWT